MWFQNLRWIVFYSKRYFKKIFLTYKWTRLLLFSLILLKSCWLIARIWFPSRALNEVRRNTHNIKYICLAKSWTELWQNQTLNQYNYSVWKKVCVVYFNALHLGVNISLLWKISTYFSNSMSYHFGMSQ